MSEIPVVKLNSCDTFRRYAGKKSCHKFKSKWWTECFSSIFFRQLDWAHLQAACNLLDSFFSPFSCCCRTIVTKHKQIIIKVSRLFVAPARPRDTDDQRATEVDFHQPGPSVWHCVVFNEIQLSAASAFSAASAWKKKKRKEKKNNMKVWCLNMSRSFCYATGGTGRSSTSQSMVPVIIRSGNELLNSKLTHTSAHAHTTETQTKGSAWNTACSFRK